MGSTFNRKKISVSKYMQASVTACAHALNKTSCEMIISVSNPIGGYILALHLLLYWRIQSTRLLVIMLMIPCGEVFLLYGLPILLWELTFGPTIAPGMCHFSINLHLFFLHLSWSSSSLLLSWSSQA